MTTHAHWHDAICVSSYLHTRYAGATSPARFCVLRTIQFSRTEPKILDRFFSVLYYLRSLSRMNRRESLSDTVVVSSAARAVDLEGFIHPVNHFFLADSTLFRFRVTVVCRCEVGWFRRLVSPCQPLFFSPFRLCFAFASPSFTARPAVLECSVHSVNHFFFGRSFFSEPLGVTRSVRCDRQWRREADTNSHPPSLSTIFDHFFWIHRFHGFLRPSPKRTPWIQPRSTRCPHPTSSVNAPTSSVSSAIVNAPTSQHLPSNQPTATQNLLRSPANVTKSFATRALTQSSTLTHANRSS